MLYILAHQVLRISLKLLPYQLTVEPLLSNSCLLTRLLVIPLAILLCFDSQGILPMSYRI
jgi:hypothetical protein